MAKNASINSQANLIFRSSSVNHSSRPIGVDRQGYPQLALTPHNITPPLAPNELGLPGTSASRHRTRVNCWCTGEDSNLRSSQGAADLQSAAINHSATCARFHSNSSQRCARVRPRNAAWRSPELGANQTRISKNRFSAWTLCVLPTPRLPPARITCLSLASMTQGTAWNILVAADIQENLTTLFAGIRSRIRPPSHQQIRMDCVSDRRDDVFPRRSSGQTQGPPQGIPEPTLAYLETTWSWRRDLNPRPSDYKSDALPAELRQRNVGAAHLRLCATNAHFWRPDKE